MAEVMSPPMPRRGTLWIGRLGSRISRVDRAPEEHKVTSGEPLGSVEPLVLRERDLWFWGGLAHGEDDQGMQIHISTDKNVHGSDALMRRVEQELESAF